MKGETNLIWEVGYLMMTYTLSTKLMRAEGDTVKGKVHLNSIVESSDDFNIARDIYKAMLKSLLETMEQKEKGEMKNGK